VIRLKDIAHGRSGDKGNHANIGIIAYTPEGFAWLERELTGDKVRGYFAGLGAEAVERHSLPGIRAYNFVLKNVLGGGASDSLRTDSQGKVLATALLEMELPDPPALQAMRPRDGAGPLAEMDAGPGSARAGGAA
jgi:hypothetical protein